jgi:diguanylate cyclase (GGDEF)-like protein
MFAYLRSLPLPFTHACALALAGGGCVAIGLIDPDFRTLAVAMCAWWALVATLRVGFSGLAALVPTLALIQHVDWWMLSAWCVVGILVVLVMALWPKTPIDEEKLHAVRNELRDAERERLLLQSHLQRYPILMESCLELSSARDLDELAEGICRRAKKIIPNVREVLVYIGTSGDPVCRASSDFANRTCPRPAGDEQRYVAAEARSFHQREGNLLRVLVPLRGDRRRAEEGDAMRGVLEVAFLAGDLNDRLAIDLLGALGRLGGLGLAAVDLLHQARSLALYDDLTGLYGKHEFMRRLDEQVALCRRDAQSLGVLMFDMDHLKQFNDQYGHQAGDQALKAVAASVHTSLPAGTIACRYGGEEFAAMFIGADATDVQEAAEKLRRTVAEAEASSTHPDRRVTISVGMAMLSGEENGQSLLARADKACYAAKARGRNRVELFL